MRHEKHLKLLKELVERPEPVRPGPGDVGEVAAAHYTSAAHFEAEARGLFAKLPQVVGVAEELALPGACLSTELAGVPLLVARGRDRELRAFRNVCRHRSTPLVAERGRCEKKGFVCPYHGWTYDLSGELVHVPHAESFGGAERERPRLHPAHVAERHGLVLAALEPFDADAFLAPIESELELLAGERFRLHRRSEREVRGNWKLVIDAFLDGYHIRQLHRETIHRFFLDACARAERAGPHIRAVTARRALRELGIEAPDLRAVATPSYLVFPNTILILHPDYLSVLVSEPLAADRTRFSHWMLVPAAEAAREAHWEKSFSLIDQGVFEREDLAAVEAMQRGLASGTNPTQLFGAHENAALWFHATLADALSS